MGWARPQSARSRGWTSAEVAIILACVVGLLALVFAFGLAPSIGRSRSVGHQAVAGAQVRSTQFALIGWAQSHNGRFPLPSAVDLADATVSEAGRAKDTSANIASILVWERLIVPEVLVDPNDKGRVSVRSGYSTSNPASAVRPAEALWDPAFSADFTSAKGGNLSWAMRQPGGGRLEHWGLSSSASRPMVSSRGAEMTGISGTPTKPRPDWANRRSIQLRRGEWDGNVAFGDGHVQFVTSLFVHGSARVNCALLPPDALFFDEPTDPESKNDYLGIFTRAGDSLADFRAIWD
ncbi:MAG TPA: hypothetical protein DEB06_03810 [Phycisphaerales bacterium]|nr:hypothetical protein [Phycisphaerales bacterium]